MYCYIISVFIIYLTKNFINEKDWWFNRKLVVSICKYQLKSKHVFITKTL